MAVKSITTCKYFLTWLRLSLTGLGVALLPRILQKGLSTIWLTHTPDTLCIARFISTFLIKLTIDTYSWYVFHTPTIYSIMNMCPRHFIFFCDWYFHFGRWIQSDIFIFNVRYMCSSTVTTVNYSKCYLGLLPVHSIAFTIRVDGHILAHTLHDVWGFWLKSIAGGLFACRI